MPICAQTALFLSVLLISACGGGASSDDGFQNTTSPPDEQEISNPYRLISTEELQKRLPTPSPTQLGTNDEGIWLIEASTESKYRSEEAENSYDITYYNHGTQVAIVYERNGEFYTTLCATPLEANLGSDAPLSIEDDTITYETSEYENLLSRWSDVTLTVVLDPQHVSFQGTFKHNIYYDDSSEVAYTTNLAGIKLSNSSTFTEAMSAYNINFNLKVNSAESNLAELGNNIACIGASIGVGKGTTENEKFEHSEEYGAAFIRTDNKVEFFSQNSVEGTIEESRYIFNQSIIEGQGDPYADGTCEGCSPHKKGSFNIELKPASAELSAAGTGTDADDETLEWSFSFSEL